MMRGALIEFSGLIALMGLRSASLLNFSRPALAFRLSLSGRPISLSYDPGRGAFRVLFEKPAVS